VIHIDAKKVVNQMRKRAANPRQNRQADPSVRNSPIMFQAMGGRSTEASVPLNE
jgi:hypothetical protein